jgi:hypothetical protein
LRHLGGWSPVIKIWLCFVAIWQFSIHRTFTAKHVAQRNQTSKGASSVQPSFVENMGRCVNRNAAAKSFVVLSKMTGKIFALTSWAAVPTPRRGTNANNSHVGISDANSTKRVHHAMLVIRPKFRTCCNLT